MPEQVKAPSKDEKFEINSASTGITETDGSTTLWVDNWDYVVQTNQKIVIKPEDIFACYLVGDDASEMPAKTRVRVVRRDVTNEDSTPLIPELPYQSAKDFQDKNKLMRFRSLRTPEVVLGEGEHLVVQVAGADVATTGDLDASASFFKIMCHRRRKPL